MPYINWGPIILACLILAGCASPERVKADNTFTVAQGTQLNLDELHIGVVSVSDNAAVLSILLSDTSQTVTLPVGDAISRDKYTIRNLKTHTNLLPGLLPGQSSGSVELQVTS